MAEISIQNLSFYYPGQEKPALKEISLHISQGEFVVLIGRSGSGKSTLLRHLKPVLTPKGAGQGSILLDTQPIEALSLREQAERIGFLLQNPEHQLIAEDVWQEMAFGLENLGYDTGTIRMRVAEMANYFGIQHWFGQKTGTLSGGQKQLLNLACLLAMHPDILLLDEPLSQLDPIAAENFLVTLHKINRELGTTIILSEHRLEQVLPEADRVLVIEQGQLCCDAPPRDAAAWLAAEEHPMFASMPAPVQVGIGLGAERLPLTVREGRELLEAQPPKRAELPHRPAAQGEPVLQAKQLYMRYTKEGKDVLRGLNMTLHRGELYGLLGGNGAGKSTLLQVLCGVRRAYIGKIEKDKYTSIAMLPQDVQTLFCKETVREELQDMTADTYRIAEMAALWQLEDLLEQHPYDLSGGEQQRLGFAKVWLTQADVLLLDEPTKGMEQGFKARLAEIFAAEKAKGHSIFMSTHDIEFCARYADRCGMLFDGTLTAEAQAHTFFGRHMFYTTAVNRMARNIYPAAITVEDAIALWK